LWNFEAPQEKKRLVQYHTNGPFNPFGLGKEAASEASISISSPIDTTSDFLNSRPSLATGNSQGWGTQKGCLY
jgi:hypothetical protein